VGALTPEATNRMALNVRNAEYFYIRIEDQPEKAYDLLAQLATAEVSLLAFSAVPFGPNHLELTIFPDRSDKFVDIARKLGWAVAGPQHAFLVQGDDNLGALADIQRMLLEADVEIYASSGVTDGNGHFGYVIYFKEEDHERAARALGAVTAPNAIEPAAMPVKG
jgi:hypothetical protein